MVILDLVNYNRHDGGNFVLIVSKTTDRKGPRDRLSEVIEDFCLYL